MQVAASMPATTTVPRIRREAAPAPWRDPERHAAEDEGERRHEDGPEPELRALKRGLDQGFALLEFGLRELDDQDRVLGREADEHDEADLGVDVEVEVPQEEAEQRADDGDGDREQHAERQRPALVEGGQNQEDEDEREHEDPAASCPEAFFSWYERSDQS